MSNVTHVTDATFDEQVIQSEVPVLVDFWAPWCGPCRMVAPVLEQIAEKYQGRAKVVKVNVDEEQRVAGQMGVRSIPTIALFHNGRAVETVVGARPAEAFSRILDKH